MINKPQTFEEALDRVLAEMRAVMIERQKKYGPKNILEAGMLGVIHRAGQDKMNRLLNYYGRQDLRERCTEAGVPQDIINRYLPAAQGDFADEKVDDTHIDMANYAGPIALMLRRGWWGLPMEDAER